MMREIEMTDMKANKNVEKKCPTCGKSLRKVGNTGKFRCSNPQCPVVFAGANDYRRVGFEVEVDGEDKDVISRMWLGIE
ncbi:MAG: hypothetical protein JSW22_03005 [Chloroflexota bacterium]|nr:MAG: hypothetical protein JSW22_03005 [Chloroflexota bacterium]